MKRKKKFALIGCAGFIAKKHVSIIKKINGELILALDKHDNVGYLDTYFPECIFLKRENIFFKKIKEMKLDYVVICSPNYLHYKHINLSLKSNSNVICEKPTVLNITDLKKIQKLEAKTNKRCYSLFQLRYNTNLINLKNKIKKLGKKNKPLKIEISYNTPRGNWYQSSWKSNKKLSGGLIYNIGVHFFDMISWFFGKSISNIIHINDKDIVKGETTFNKAIVKWKLSTEFKKKINNSSFDRYIKFNSKTINFTKNFNDLHFKAYKNIIIGKGIKTMDILTTFRNLEKLKK
mgnify:CR=1 FL=1|tara:strand:- start:35784 stop:36656 length:873 start_codon:yes stop_codon:yes gene_type:complete